MRQNKTKRNFFVFAAISVLAFGLSACSSGAGEGKMPNNVPSGKEQEPSGGKEVGTQDLPPSKKPDKAPEIQENTELTEKDSDLMDGEQKQPKEPDTVPGEEAEGQKDFVVDSPEPTKEGQEQMEKDQPEEETQTWKSAYLEVIYHLWDYLAPRYEPLNGEEIRKKYDDPMNLTIFYLGLHDFDGDGILELITGDDSGLAVFTYEDGNVKKIADLCDPDLSAIWCVNGVSFRNNSIQVECDGSGGINYVNFGYIEGEYVLGHCNQWTPTIPITINGREGTLEEMDRIYKLDYDKREEGETRERFWLVNENGIWIMKQVGADEGKVLDMDFDFDSVIW